jgi:hypothetical protein
MKGKHDERKKNVKCQNRNYYKKIEHRASHQKKQTIVVGFYEFEIGNNRKNSFVMKKMFLLREHLALL